MQTEHWAETVTSQALARASVERTEAERARDARARLLAAVNDRGAVFFQRVTAEVDATAAAVNTSVGRRLLRALLAPTGAVSIRCDDDGAYVLIARDLSTEDDNQPGAVVTVQVASRRTVEPFYFDLDGDDLAIRHHGELRGPEAFIRAELEPWLRCLPLGGRRV
jgi:hypothetical protein